ncbi:MAG: DUF3105 domain-containing protein [Chloroflexota bacterium]|nr:DUF3105 domain-containing protein [Chloroflexota bacterium]
MSSREPRTRTTPEAGVSADSATKREKRLAAREARKQKAVAAQRRARITRVILLTVLAVLLAAFTVVAFTTSFFGLMAASVGRTVATLPADHVAEGTPVEYNSRPPTSGPHYAAWYPSYGLVNETIDPRTWVHNLEHGAVVLLYNCPEGCPDLVQQLRELYITLPPGRNARNGQPRMLIIPYTDMDSRIAVVAWGWLLELDQFDADQITRFYDARIDRGPECVNLRCPS